MKEIEIRPKKLFEKFIYFTKLDIKKYFKRSRKEINCVACNKKGRFSFKKNNFIYAECINCNTLFVSPRPNESEFSEYYTKASSIKYLAKSYYKKTEEIRKSKIWKPKAKLISKILKKNNLVKSNCIDIGGGYGVFAKEIKKNIRGKSVVIEPSPFLAKESRKKKLIVIQKFLEAVKKKDLPIGKNLFTCFELMEHLFDPSRFIKSVRKLMNKGDLLILTTLSSTGIDISTLWENSRSINPPHHINFFNPKSISIFLKKNKFKILDISTPGNIDINILDNDRLLIKDRFWKNFIKTANKNEKLKMQNLISKLNFSSHMMVVCKK
jgi:2-polyprenyl-3-methyl-5-hydroxy-6-metoxy-1,4-benzoquinol methylase